MLYYTVKYFFDDHADELFVFTWFLFISAFVGVISYKLLNPKKYKNVKTWKKTIFIIIAGMIIVLIAGIHPLVLMVVIYLLGAFFLIIRSKEWGGKRIIERTVFMAFTELALTQFLVSYHVSFLAFQASTADGHAKTNLASIASAELYYYSENHKFVADFKAIGWEPLGINRYSYYLDSVKKPNTYFARDVSDLHSINLAVNISKNKTVRWLDQYQIIQVFNNEAFHPTQANLDKIEDEKIITLKQKYGIGVSGDNFTAVAIGNIDDDYFLDVWIIDKNKIPIRIENDRIDKTMVIRRDLWIMETYDDHVNIYAARVSMILILLNAIIWVYIRFRLKW